MKLRDLPDKIFTKDYLSGSSSSHDLERDITRGSTAAPGRRRAGAAGRPRFPVDKPSVTRPCSAAEVPLCGAPMADVKESAQDVLHEDFVRRRRMPCRTRPRDDRPAARRPARAPDAARKNTGETVFADRPLRFRSLTVAEAGPAGSRRRRLPWRLQDPGREAWPGGGAKPGSWSSDRYAGRGYTIPSAPNEEPRSRHSSPTTRGSSSVRSASVSIRTGIVRRRALPGRSSTCCASRATRICEFTRLADRQESREQARARRACSTRPISTPR